MYTAGRGLADLSSPRPPHPAIAVVPNLLCCHSGDDTQQALPAGHYEFLDGGQFGSSELTQLTCVSSHKRLDVSSGSV